MIENRHNFILRTIRDQGEATIGDLAAQLNVSEMTIRRDLKELEAEQLLKRVHGGAVIATGRSYEPPLLIRSETEIDAKANIGKHAASLVEDGDSVAIDIGSTTYELAQNLGAKKNLTIITPGLYIANLFLNKPDIRIILAGGIIRHGEGSLTGQLTVKAFEGLFVDKLFLGMGGINAQAGCTEYNWEDTIVKQAMVRSAKEVIALVDASKFDVIAFAQICPLTSLKRLITNQMPTHDLYQALKEAKVEIDLVASSNTQ
jgi:DeoR/GlpR family transcriptional regulator of sugar metabolism